MKRKVLFSLLSLVFFILHGSNLNAQNVAKILEKEYETLKEAVESAQDGETVVILRDIEIVDETCTIVDGKSITLDMNGKKITVTDSKTNGNYELFYNYGELHVKGNGTIELTAVNNRYWNAMSTIFHNRGGVLVIDNGTFTHKGGTDMAYVIDNSGNYYGDATTIINDGTFVSSYIAIRNRMEQNNHGASGKTYLTVKGGTISAPRRAIWSQAASASETSPATGEINIEGGVINGLIETACSKDAVSMTTISGGTVGSFKGETGELKVIGGGEITDDITILDPNGSVVESMQNGEGIYVMVIAKIDDEPYESFSKAFEVANASETEATITLINDASVDGKLEIEKNITVDLNGKAYNAKNVSPEETAISVPEGKTLTLKGGKMIADSELPAFIETQGILVMDNVTFEGEPINVIISGNGQLDTKSAVTAMWKKNIEAYSDGDSDNKLESGWYTISAPFGNTNHNLQDTEGYELFQYVEKTATWLNYKGDDFAMKSGIGYIYAHSGNVEVSISGTTVTDDFTATPTVTEAVGELEGFNLYGNPFAKNITGEHVTGDLADGYYTLSNCGSWIAKEMTDGIAVGEGFLVQALGTEDVTISYDKPAPRASDNGSIRINVANNIYSDVAYVSFNEGISLNKISHHNAEVPMVYITMNNDKYSIAYMNDEVEEIPFSFEAKTMGSYTIGIKTKDCEYENITLVDRLTGIETNMLLEDYSFIGSPDEKSERFIIRLSARYDDMSDDDNFAIVNGNELIIANLSDNATVQIYDIMGRPVTSYVLSGTANISMETLANGIYVVRLIDENDVKSQKVVID